MAVLPKVSPPSLQHSTEDASSTGDLKGRLGTIDIVFTVLAYNAPLTVVVGFTPLLISEGNGLGTPLAFTFAALLLMMFAFGFTAMAQHAPNPGAFYSYITVGLGRHLGLGSAFLAIMAYFFIMIALYCYAGISYANFASNLTGESFMPWWGWTFLVAALVSVFGYLKITFSATLLTIALLLEIITVFFWEGSVISHVGIGNISTEWLSLDAFSSGSVGIGILLAVVSFAGFEATAVFREEARNPAKTIPRAAFVAVAMMAFLYITSSIVFITAFGADTVVAVSKADPAMAMFNSIEQYIGKHGLLLVNVLLCSSTFACVLALHNIAARYVYSLALDGVLAKVFSVIHPRYDSPYRASVLVSVVTLVIIGFCLLNNIDPYKAYGLLNAIGGYALMILELLTATSIIMYFRKVKHYYGIWRVYVAPALATGGLIATSWLATTNMELLAGDASMAYSFIGLAFLLLLGGSIYAQYLKAKKPNSYKRIGRQTL